MIYVGKANATIITILLLAFSIAAALSSDVTVGLRGGGDINSNQNGRQLANERISVFRCDSENRTITSTISNKTEELEEFGFDVRICFRVTKQAVINDLFILKIDDFAFTKDRTNGDLAAAGPTRQIPVIMRQSAVDHGVPMSDELTNIQCEPGAEICAIETRLTGYFFLTNGIIRGKGSILMQRGKNGRRELQQMENFEDVYIELDFTGGGRNPMAKKTRIIIIVSVILGLLLLLCCFGVCCLMGLCCFAGRKRKNEDTDEDNVEEVSVKIEWDPAAKKSKKGDAEDMSETESLEDDKYWDDEVDISDDENESHGDGVEERGGTAVVPGQQAQESFSSKKSKKKAKSEREAKSSTYDFGDNDWHDGDDSEPKEEMDEKSKEYSNRDFETEDISPVQESEEEPPKKKKSKKKSKKKTERHE